mmetsp:Transcript_40912/g.65739  ORF Transcript_40912/g.65739 Transcript_40912/m.65739 type:complete len:113 (+) Transcript_40912:490-828(+)
MEQGETQLATSQMVSEDEPSIVWNFPIDLSLLSTNFSGWPRIALTIRDGNRSLIGYGSVHVPTKGGQFVRYCKLFAPLASSAIGDVIANVNQEYPEFYDARFSTACVGREGR